MFSAITWSPGIGDPTWIGWLTTAGYLGAAWLCFYSFLRAESRMGTRRLWLVLAAGMLLLGLNKQLDLQTLLTEIGRKLAYQEGWYAQRRQVQAVFAAVVSVLFVASVVSIFFIARRKSWEVRFSLVGAMLVFAYAVIRVATFEHVGLRDLGENLTAVVELGGIACVAGGAWRWSRQRKSATEEHCGNGR